jgi:serine/threonine protein kinase
MVANPKYDTSVDEFSYGILMIHIFSGRWPEPQVGPVRTEPGKMTPVSEAERREVYLQEIGNDHPLLDLIIKCIDNHPQSRAHTAEIVKRLAEISMRFCDSQQGMMRRDTEMTNGLSKDNGRKGEAILEGRDSLTHNDHKLKIAHSSEIALLKSKLRDTDAKFNLYRAESEAKIMELKSTAALDKTQMENKDRILLEERKQFETQLAKEREVNRRLLVKNGDLQSEVDSLQHANSVLQSSTVEKDSAIARKEATIKRKDLEIKAKIAGLREKDAIISEFCEQLTKARVCLTTNQSVSMQFYVPPKGGL